MNGMAQEPLTIYKLIILYMLDRVEFPLTKAQIGDFILGQGYTNFINLQQAIGELMDSDLIKGQSMRNRTHLSITKEGQETIRFFGNRINETIRGEIDSYLKDNALAIRNEISVYGEYYKATSGEYEAHLVAKDRGEKLVDITLSVPVEEAASTICENWQKRNQEIYQYLVKTLF